MIFLVSVFSKTVEETWSVQSSVCMFTSLLGWWSGWYQGWRKVPSRPFYLGLSILLCIYVGFSFSCIIISTNICVAVLLVIHVIFGYRVLLCLKRALRIANASQQMASAVRGSSGPVTLFVEILNKSVVLGLLPDWTLHTRENIHASFMYYTCWKIILNWSLHFCQVRLLFREKWSPDHTCCNPGADRINQQWVAKWVYDPNLRSFLCKHIAVHPVPETERRSNGREICFYQGLKTRGVWSPKMFYK